MVIETDARRFIVEAIKLEQSISDCEQNLKKRNMPITPLNKEYNELRSKFLLKICEINTVANVMGKGRDDFRIDILNKAEDIAKKGSNSQSSAVRKLAENIKQSYHTMRILVRKYNENVEVVDPQLKNNQELVEVLNDFEKAWALGKEHLMDGAKCQQLIQFS